MKPKEENIRKCKSGLFSARKRECFLGMCILVAVVVFTAPVLLSSLGGCGGEIQVSATCGDDTAEGEEVCDGTDLRGEDCESLGYEGGTLLCDETCDGFDASLCQGTGPMCGDDTAEGDEVCDGVDLRGEDCESLGYEGGTLLCDETCDGFNTSGCTAIVCGDDVAEGDEVCDGTDLQGEDCVSQGFGSGTLACNSTCDGFDVSGCVSPCESGPGKEIVDLLNEYRMENNLDPIPCSPSLMTVSETHVWDLYDHQPHGPAECNLHSWSDQGSWTPCCYTSDHAQAACMWNKPSELTVYSGSGYENAAAGASSPAGALSMWKNSSGHNAVMLNEGIWAGRTWRAVGAALYQGYAVLWFGEQTDPDG